ncbi:platelet-activating factor acetylhydrolase isoform II [Streptomyces sp. TLI_235]|nr:alpha/beta hydrolase [Streptomyces sp. TLI_235]PBC70580.1 platelet-activating factor acetylhydrolase isoform II [Streptomyces sp. TLI_235]
MKRNRRISAVAVLTLAALITGTGAGFAATTTPSATPVATHAFDTAPATATATAPTPSFHGTLPAPTGPYAAGEDIIHLTDTSRLDPWVPSSGPRQLTVTMVYPAVPGTGTPAPYMTVAEAAGITERRKMPASYGVTPQTLSSVTTHAFDGARPQRGKHPLVVLSAASENPRMMLTSLATDLASHGYVVALVGHTYEDSGETLANGQTPPCAICDHPETIDFDAEAVSRGRDVSFVIDQLTHGNTAWRLAHLIDKHEIGMAGHSLGGAAAAATMIADPRVRAGVDMDGTFHPVPMPGQINRPFLMLDSDGHTPGSGDSIVGRAWAALGGYKKWLTVAGADHFSFSDLDVLQEQAGFPTGPLSPERGVVITREYVTAFFDQTLKGIHSPLLDGPSPNNPEVAFQS